MAKVLGVGLHVRRLANMTSKRAEKQIGDGVEAGLTLIKNYAVDSIKDGAVSGPGHVPSAPGEPPNADTHELDKSISVVMNRNRLGGRVEAASEKAKPLEFGTSTVAERPFMRPASKAKRAEAVALIGRATSRTTKG